MSRFGIVNVRMVITEEKILSNIDKVQKMINPNSKKQIIELDENSYFKDLVESIKAYLIEYPKKNNFPVDVYKATYGLIEFATTQFEENTKKIEELIKHREENIALSGVLKEVVEAAENKEDGWEEKVDGISDKFDEDIIENLKIVGKAKTKTSQKYTDSARILKARVNNLESNLHIEIDMERLEDSSKALSYIGIEVADALKLIPVPEEQLQIVEAENALEAEQEEEESKAVNEIFTDNSVETADKVARNVANKYEDKTTNEVAVRTEKDDREVVIPKEISAIKEQPKEKIRENVETVSENNLDAEKELYAQETTFEAKPSLWQRFKKSKFVRAATYVFKIRIRIELPSNALPEGRGENQ